MASKIIPDDLITTINDFKSSSNGQMINIHGKEYATVSHRVAVLRRNLGAKLSITTEVVSIDENKVVVKATGSICSDLSLSNVSLRENLTVIPSHSKLSSYAIADLSDEIIVWNTTLG